MINVAACCKTKYIRYFLCWTCLSSCPFLIGLLGRLFDCQLYLILHNINGFSSRHPVFWTGQAGTGSIWMDDLDCNGEEIDLSGCAFSGWSYNDCSHTEDISVNCGKYTKAY